MVVRILVGHVIDRLRAVPDESVHMVVTSPPYYGLRSYGTPAQVWGGDAACEHRWSDATVVDSMPEEQPSPKQGTNTGSHQRGVKPASFCDTCGAWRGDLGLEPTPTLFIEHLVEVFREVRRVLRKDGTLWLNIGSSFASTRIESDQCVIKRSLSPNVRSAIAQALSAVWSGHESAEQALQGLLRQEDRPAPELSRPDMPGLRDGVPRPRLSRSEEPRDVLFTQMRSLRESDKEAIYSGDALPVLREIGEADAGGHAEEPDGQGVLFGGVLAQPQPTGEALSLGRRPSAEDDAPGAAVAQGRSGAGSRPLPPVLLDAPPRSSSHQAIPQSCGGTQRSHERDHTLPTLPQADRPGRDVDSRGIDPDSQRALCHLADITFPKGAIPPVFAAWCEAASVAKPKDDLAIPSLLSLALRADGWYLRSDIIWAKPNPMPESVTDRCTKAHEYLFLLSKSERYYYDAEAIKEPSITGDPRRPYTSEGAWQMDGRPAEQRHGGKPRTAGNKSHKYVTAYEGSDSEERRTKAGLMKIADVPWNSRNRRSVWTIATSPYPDAHFATFPPDLVEPCILAGTSEYGVCGKCGGPWERVVEKQFIPQQDVSEERGIRCAEGQKAMDATSGWPGVPRGTSAGKTLGWRPACACGPDAGMRAAVVLDPFGGAGTTALVADRLKRDAILIELSPAYAEMARRRIEADAGLFANIAVD